MKKKTIKLLATIIIVILLAICGFLAYKLYDANSQIEKLNNTNSQTNVQTSNTEEKTNTSAKVEENINGKVSVYEDSQRGVRIALVEYDSEDNSNNTHVIVTLETRYSIEYMYGSYYTSQGQTYLYFKEDIGELRLNGIDGIEVTPNSNGGTNVKVNVTEDTLVIGNGTLNRVK